MSELSSSGKISANNTNNSKTQGKNAEMHDPVANGQNQRGLNSKEAVIGNFSYKDSFNSGTAGVTAEKNMYNPGTLNNSGWKPFESIQNTGRNLLNPAVNISNTLRQGLYNSFNTMQINTQNSLNNILSRFIDIMDKISAVYGEREKDIREKLSDTFNQLEQKTYPLLAAINSSMEQKDHHKEKKTKDPEAKSDEDESKTSQPHRID